MSENVNFLNGIFVDFNENISCRQGDSGYVTVTGLPTDKDYKLCLAVSVPQTKEIVGEVTAQTEMQDSVQVSIPSAFTEKIGTGRFYYAIKLVDGEDEYTVVPKAYTDENGEVAIANPPIFFVKRKLAEGGEA